MKFSTLANICRNTFRFGIIGDAVALAQCSYSVVRSYKNEIIECAMFKDCGSKSDRIYEVMSRFIGDENGGK